MKESYFIRVSRQTPTKFWINNPSRAQAGLAIAHGAAGCTCNPSYTQKMVDSPEEGEYALHLLDESIRETELDKYTAEVFQRKLVAPVAECFVPVFTNSAEVDGYVASGRPSMTKTPKKSCARRATTGLLARTFAVKYRPQRLA